MDTPTMFLYARPSFVEGIARILDFGDTLSEYNTAVIPEQADYLALMADWNAVGDDLRNALMEALKECDSKSRK